MNVYRMASGVCLIGAAAILGATAARGQCQTWQPGHSRVGTSGAVFTTCVFDDGTGPALFAGGLFSAVGNDPIQDIAKWDGMRWSPLDLGSNGAVQALAVFDDGSGPALYVGGDFTDISGMPVNHIARWNGQRWSTVGSGANNSVDALCVFDDGSGPALYAGGAFNSMNGVSANSIAKWDGATWSPLGSGVDPIVLSLVVFDDGSGPALFAAGTFQNAGGASANRVAKWNGSSWSPLGSGMNDIVHTLALFDDGSGVKLYAGGDFTTAGGGAANRVARWDGSTWSVLAGGFNNTVLALSAFDLGSGALLYAGGDFFGATGSGVSRWNGANWSPLGGGISGSGGVHSFTGFDDGNGPAIFVGGSFTSINSSPGGLNSRSIAKWDGANWAGVGGGTDAQMDVLAVFDDGTGPALYAGGAFQSAGSVSAKHIAKYKNGHFTALGSGLSGVTFPTAFAMASFDDGSGPALYVGGSFTNAGGVSVTNLAKWNGSSWSAVSNVAVGGTFTGADALTVFDDGSGAALYSHGTFTPTSSSPRNAIAKWNGSVWTPIGDANSVEALIGFDDGTGPALYAAGSFSMIGGVAANWIAKWNGSTWSPLGSGTDQGNGIHCLAVFDDGSGRALYAGGGFTMIRGVTAPARVARWNGSAWSGVGTDVMDNSGTIYALQAFDDGSGAGAALYVAGEFFTLGGNSVHSIARWNGSSWSTLGAGLESYVYALSVFDPGGGGGADLWAGGMIDKAGGLGAGNFAQWNGCGRPGVPMCFGDGSGGMCPCSNFGLTARGCNNSASTGGALLSSSGWASLAFDSLKLTSTHELSSAFSVFLQGTTEISPSPFGDGLRCAGGNLKRLYTKPASAGSVSAPQSGDLSISARSAALGNVIGVATTRVYQVYYRDPSLTFCPSPTGNTWNVSSGLKIEWLP